MDVYRIVAGIVSLIAGGAVISRLLTSEFNPIALMLGIAFLALGLYRLNMAARRYAEFRLGQAQAPTGERQKER